MTSTLPRKGSPVKKGNVRTLWYAPKGSGPVLVVATFQFEGWDKLQWFQVGRGNTQFDLHYLGGRLFETEDEAWKCCLDSARLDVEYHQVQLTSAESILADLSGKYLEQRQQKGQ